MTARPVPHIGATMTHRATLYQLHQNELDAERERMERIDAALQVDALIDRIRQHDASGCDESAYQPPVSPWVFWPVVVGFSAALTFAAYEFATRVLPVLWQVLS